jgi:hypothetical protein
MCPDHTVRVLTRCSSGQGFPPPLSGGVAEKSNDRDDMKKLNEEIHVHAA